MFGEIRHIIPADLQPVGGGQHRGDAMREMLYPAAMAGRTIPGREALTPASREFCVPFERLLPSWEFGT